MANRATGGKATATAPMDLGDGPPVPAPALPDADADAGATDDRPVLLLADAYGLIFRAYHAVPAGITTSRGEQVNAVFGFASMLLDVLRNERPDYAVVAFEGGKTRREEQYPDYKAHRGPMPEDLRPQVARIRDLLDALCVPTEEAAGYEADDVIGSLAEKAKARGDLRVVVVTGDSDLLQLVDDGVTVVLPGAQRFGDTRLFDTAAVFARYGFGPELVPDYKALVGDTSDNIPGVAGIGDKTAKALIAQFGGVTEILAHVEEITPARARNAIAANPESARLSLELATINRDLDVPLDLETAAVGDYDREAVIELFRELEFRSLMQRLPEPKTARAQAAPQERPAVAVRTIVDSPEALDGLAARLEETGLAAIDTETDALDPRHANLVGIALAVSPEESWYVPLRHPLDSSTPRLLDLAEVRERLAPVLSRLRFSAHHAKYDLVVLEREGFPLGELAFETMLAAYLLGETSMRLKDLSFTRLGRQMTEITELIGTGRGQLTMDMVDARQAGEYACADVEVTYALADLLAPEIEREGMGPLLREIEQPLVPVLVEMEKNGIAIDVPYLNALGGEIAARMTELEGEITELAGRELKVGSPKQLGAFLFEELGLPTGRKTKTGYSVDADVLEGLRDKHPIVEAIVEHRQLAKLRSTYVDALPGQVDPTTGRVHTSFNQTIAATGRLSSIDPNLQNIPIRTELGKRVRRAFVADRRPEFALVPDAVLMSADYSQIELRLLADRSGEPFLVEAFNAGDDIHGATAAVVAGVEPKDVTPDMRRVAKTVNFGVLYGMQAFGLSRDTGLPRAEAQAFIDQYWARLPRVKAFFDETLAAGTRCGYVEAPSGRRRATPDLTSPNGQRRMAAERMAINMPLQGGAADIMKLAMIRVDAALRERPRLRSKLLLQVHDELVLEVAPGERAALEALVREQMGGAAALTVPLDVSVGVGLSWQDAGH